MLPPLLTAHDATGHIHLVIGANPLANTRCVNSLTVGATPVVIAPASVNMHYSLQQKVDEGLVKWLDKEFEDGDVETLGRRDVDGFVDAVFVTRSGISPLSKSSYESWRTSTNKDQTIIFLRSVGGREYLSM